MLFVFELGSRHQLDYPFDSDGPEVLANLERLAGTAQTTRPVNKTLEYFLSCVGSAPVAGLVQKMVNRLVRMKALAWIAHKSDIAYPNYQIRSILLNWVRGTPSVRNPG